MMNKVFAGGVNVSTTVTCCILAAICEGIDLQAAGVAAAGITREYQPLGDQLGTFFSASTVGLLFGAIIGGRISDLVGRKAVLVNSVVMFGLMSLLTPMAWSIQSLSWVRFLTGLGLGGALPNLLALTNESSSPARRRANVALVYAGNPLGGVIASALMLGMNVDHWRWIFVVGGIFPLLIAPVMQVSIKNPRAVPSEVGLGTNDAAAPTISIFSKNNLLSTLFLWVSFCFGLMTLYLLLSWLPTLLAGNGLTKPQVAVAQIAFNVGGAAAALGIGQVLEGRWRVLGVLAVLSSVPGLIILLAKSGTQTPAVVVAIVFGLGCTVLAAQAFLYAEAPTRYTARIRGIGVGAAIAAGRLGSIAGPQLGGYLKMAGHDTARLLMDVVPLVLVGSAVAAALLFYRPTLED